MCREGVPCRPHGFDHLPADDLDAALFHFGVQVSADIVVEAAQDIFAAIDQSHVGSQTVKNSRKFDCDIATALDHDALRQFLQVERLVRADDVLDAGDFGAVPGPAAGSNENVFGPDLFAG